MKITLVAFLVILILSTYSCSSESVYYEEYSGVVESVEYVGTDSMFSNVTTVVTFDNGMVLTSGGRLRQPIYLGQCVATTYSKITQSIVDVELRDKC